MDGNVVVVRVELRYEFLMRSRLDVCAHHVCMYVDGPCSFVRSSYIPVTRMQETTPTTMRPLIPTPLYPESRGISLCHPSIHPSI